MFELLKDVEDVKLVAQNVFLPLFAGIYFFNLIKYIDWSDSLGLLDSSFVTKFLAEIQAITRLNNLWKIFFFSNF